MLVLLTLTGPLGISSVLRLVKNIVFVFCVRWCIFYISENNLCDFGRHCVRERWCSSAKLCSVVCKQFTMTVSECWIIIVRGPDERQLPWAMVWDEAVSGEKLNLIILWSFFSTPTFSTDIPIDRPSWMWVLMCVIILVNWQIVDLPLLKPSFFQEGCYSCYVDRDILGFGESHISPEFCWRDLTEIWWRSSRGNRHIT